jgi:hypothetical protein
VEPRSRSRAVLLLAAVVVSVMGVSWLATGGISRLLTLPKPTAKPFVESLPSLVSQGCSPAEFELSGAFNDCANVSRYESIRCQVSSRVLGGQLLLTGRHNSFLLYIEVHGSYGGPGVYDLSPWVHGLGENDVPKAAVREYTTGALWQSVAGVLGVTSADGQSGFINAELTYVGGAGPTPPRSQLSILGDWTC